MNKTIKVDNYDELVTYAVEFMNDGYEFDELDGSFSDGGAIVMRCYEDDSKVVLICEDDTEADGVYGDLYSFMKQACKSVFEAYMRSSVYNK